MILGLGVCAAVRQTVEMGIHGQGGANNARLP